MLLFIKAVFPSSLFTGNETRPVSCDMDYEDIVIADNTAQLVFSTDFSVTKYGFHIAVQSGMNLVLSPDIRLRQADPIRPVHTKRKRKFCHLLSFIFLAFVLL